MRRRWIVKAAYRSHAYRLGNWMARKNCAAVHHPLSREAGRLQPEAGFLTSRSALAGCLPIRCRTVAETPQLPRYSGGTVRDFHPLPSWLTLDGEHLRPRRKIAYAGNAVNETTKRPRNFAQGGGRGCRDARMTGKGGRVACARRFAEPVSPQAGVMSKELPVPLREKANGGRRCIGCVEG